MKKVLLYLWQLPQNIVALIYLTYLCIIDTIYTIEDKDDIKVVKKFTTGGVSLGNYIFVTSYSIHLDYLIKHELGHTKQSKMLGPLYLLLVGLPSIIWAYLHRFIGGDYYRFYTEKWANKLGGNT